MKNGPLILIVLFISLAIAAWLILSQPSESIAFQEGGTVASTDGEPASAVEADRGVEPSSAAPEQSEPAAQRTRDTTELGHRIQVLDSQGNPMADVPVVVYVDHDDPHRFDEMASSMVPGEFAGMQVNTNAPRTNQDGIVELDQRMHCFAWTAIEGAAGFVLCPEIPVGEPPTLQTLQLHAAPMVEVIVLDGEGRPVTDRLRFNAYVGSAKALDLQPTDMEFMAYGSAWSHSPNAVRSLVDGRQFYCLIPPAHARKKIGDSSGFNRHHLELQYAGLELPPKVFEDDVSGPLVFQLPESGTLTLHLEGYPEGATPGIAALGSDSQLQRGAEVEGSNGQTWRFSDVAVGKSWKVGFWCQSGEGRERHLVGTSLPQVEVPGPLSSGEQAEVQLEFAWPSGFHGRLIFPEEAGVSWNQFISDGNRGYLDAQLCFHSGIQRRDWARVGVFPDGRFFIPLDPERRSHENTAAVSGFELVFRADEPRVVPEGWVPARLWAFVDASLPALQASVDVGEVKLQHHEPMFKVVVSDPSGEPVSGAEASISFAADWDRPELDREQFHGTGRDSATDARGEAWLIARDWKSLGRVFRVGAKDVVANPVVHTVRIKVQHADYLPAQVDASGGERTARVTLVPAAILEGSVLAFRSGTAILADLLPVGGALGEGVRHVTIHGARNGEETRDFKIEGVPLGTWDVVFKLSSHRDKELLRVSGVEVSGSGAVRDPRLQRVDFGRVLGELRLRLFREGGGRLTPAEISEAKIRLRKYSGNGGFSTGSPDWDGEEIVTLMPADAEFKLGVEGDGWATEELGALRPGTHDVYLKRLNESKVRITNFAQLPEGVELDLMVMPVRSSGILFLIQGKIDQADVPVFWQSVGEHSATWELKKNSAGWRSQRITTKIAITEEQMQAGSVLELAIPEKLLAAIPD